MATKGAEKAVKRILSGREWTDNGLHKRFAEMVIDNEIHYAEMLVFIERIANIKESYNIEELVREANELIAKVKE